MQPRSCFHGTNILTNVNVQDKGRSFGFNKQQAMKVDFDQVANVTTSKDEVVLVMRHDDASKYSFNLAEMRFFVPNTRTKEESGNSAQAIAENVKGHFKIDGRQQS